MKGMLKILEARGFPHPHAGRVRYGVRAAFTLIELLAVIAIIGLLAGLAIGVSGLVVEKNRVARMRGEHANLLTAIESYKAELGTYPPDHPSLNTANDTNRYQWARMNSLFYELSGAIFTNKAPGVNTFLTLGTAEEISPTTLKNQFGVDGIQNSARRPGEVAYRNMRFKPSQFAEINVTEDVEVLVTPVKGPGHVEMDGKLAGGGVKKLNPWMYDASSTNRHNPETFDLWAEYLGKKRTNIIGNWKE
jgi:prepilin-type N-terminal cleavage/methylation domain-containing protein